MVGGDRMSRVQLSINVSDFDAAVAFYSRMFGPPAKLRPGYANFAVDDPPLKLVLNSPGNGPGGTINHFGVEVASTGDVMQAEARLAAESVAVEPEPGAVCCYAVQDKVWAHDPDGVPWEYYTVLEHIETP
jgi:catechol 2,3-dioxygenase-like lactoylglutathione lyase family enzyme